MHGFIYIDNFLTFDYSSYERKLELVDVIFRNNNLPKAAGTIYINNKVPSLIVKLRIHQTTFERNRTMVYSIMYVKNIVLSPDSVIESCNFRDNEALEEASIGLALYDGAFTIKN
jgi:hypothetical protein